MVRAVQSRRKRNYYLAAYIFLIVLNIFILATGIMLMLRLMRLFH